MMYEIEIVSDNYDKFRYSNITEYIIDEHYLFMKNKKEHVWYINRNCLRGVFVKEIKDDNSKI